ncbi:hypothetical protein [Nitrosomonas marina]|uniref:PEGA domain-containing protein n=1 Tax=Nitrosomonas marina TaxID=917 RepID=A0A1H8DHU8_9PROT|nr:hypothetical protein [Nitrosomonas marina]SEN06912.1 hypothetical protein SAMN05216325_10723 [Nitrosomonas marina]
MKKTILVACGVLFIFSGCATMIRGTEQEVSVNTNPPGADVQFSNGQSCISPCVIKTKRNQSLQISVTKDGCHQQTATMMPTLAGAGAMLGGFIDYGTGAVYDLHPNPLTISLICDKKIAAEN